jgi:hypothetical protein
VFKTHLLWMCQAIYFLAHEAADQESMDDMRMYSSVLKGTAESHSESVPFIYLYSLSSGLLHHLLYAFLFKPEEAKISRSMSRQSRLDPCFTLIEERGFPSLVVRSIRKNVQNTMSFYEASNWTLVNFLLISNYRPCICNSSRT